MDALSDYLRHNVSTQSVVEQESWTEVLSALQCGKDLERALEGKTLPPSLTKQIVKSTWNHVCETDFKVFESVSRGNEPPPFANLIRELFNSTNSEIHVVTTNYDRVAEFACNSAGIIVQTGFQPGYIQKWESSSPVTMRYGPRPARIVKLWKVHGSLDWFHTPHERVVSLPVFSLPDAQLSPLIVTPGLNKFEKTHEDPFRTIINGADNALGTASAFLCIGFGFRDSHICPRIVQRCREQNVPIFVLAKKLTEETKAFLRNRAGTRYLGLEQSDQGSRAFFPESPDGVLLDRANLWTLQGFNSLIM